MKAGIFFRPYSPLNCPFNQKKSCSKKLPSCPTPTTTFRITHNTCHITFLSSHIHKMGVNILSVPTLLFFMLATSVTALPVGEPVAEVTSALPPSVTGIADTGLLALKPSKLEEEEITDRYLFNITLDSFISERNQQNPSFLFWESDGCSDSPDRPFGFDYLPACYRHDFGYDQYRRVCIPTHPVRNGFFPTHIWLLLR